MVQVRARQPHPEGLHAGHFVTDRAIATAPEAANARLDPDATADSYVHFPGRPRPVCAWEIVPRPGAERFCRNAVEAAVSNAPDFLLNPVFGFDIFDLKGID